MVDTILEPQSGGRWYERGDDGSECDWGRVLAWEPPHRLVLTWQINGQWQYDPDPDRASEIEIRFTADGPQPDPGRAPAPAPRAGSSTARRMHDGIDQAGGGWSSVLELYATAATDQR